MLSVRFESGNVEHPTANVDTIKFWRSDFVEAELRERAPIEPLTLPLDIFA